MGVVPLDVRQWVQFYPAAAASRTLSRLMTAQGSGPVGRAGDRQLLEQLASTEPGARVGILRSAICRLASQVLRLSEDRLDADVPFSDLGMDSLMGLELRNRIEGALGIIVPATLLWTYPTGTALAEYLGGVLGGNGTGCSHVVEPGETWAVTKVGSSELSDDELLAALRAEI
jgi:acyl carrier protein